MTSVGVVLSVLLTGLVTGLALIVAVGAQNAFLLRQGIRGEHVLPLVLVCVLSDVLGIGAGIAGLGAVLERWPMVLPLMQVLGGVYLLAFGLQAALRAWRPSGLTPDGAPPLSLGRAVLLMLAVTWLNPHFYLDILLMLGTLANSFGDMRWGFYGGALIASAIWFPSLGYGARLLRRFFARPAAWRVLDSAIAVVMGALGVSLLVS